MIDLLQWPAMVATIVAAWLVGAKSKGRRRAGFWLFLLSNLLWTAWAVHAGAASLVVLQLALAVMNIRGYQKTEK